MKRFTTATKTLATALMMSAALALAPAPSFAASYGHQDRKPAAKIVQIDYRGQDNSRGNDRDNVKFGYDAHQYGDRFHRPPMRFEKTPPRPHFGMRFQGGHWNWGQGHWVWIAGFWMR